MKKPQVIGIGSAFVDYFLEGDEAFLKKHHLTAEIDDIADQKELFDDAIASLPLLQKSSGGASVNTIAVLSKLGIDAGYYGVTGVDSQTAFFENQLQTVDLSKTIKHGSLSKCACILTHQRTKRTFVSIENIHDNDFFTDIDYSFLNTAKIIHISPFYLKIEKSYEKLLSIIEKIKKPKISLTTSMTYAIFGLEKLTPLLKKTKFLFVNENEIFAMTGEEKEQGSRKILNYGPKIIICTLGEKGALITTPEKQFYSPGKSIEHIVDTTGAGDAFAAGFLYGVLKEKSVEVCATWGNMIGAKAVTDFGLHWTESLLEDFLRDQVS